MIGLLRMRSNLTIILAAAIWLTTAPAFAVNPDEVLSDPALEQRARVISQDLRCLVCQNQSIDDSNAPLAKDLRVIVRERLVAGDSDTQVVEYVVARYGNYVLLKPPFQRDTALLWIAPYLMFAAAFTVSGIYFLRRRSLPEDGASEQRDGNTTHTNQHQPEEY